MKPAKLKIITRITEIIGIFTWQEMQYEWRNFARCLGAKHGWSLQLFSPSSSDCTGPHRIHSVPAHLSPLDWRVPSLQNRWKVISYFKSTPTTKSQCSIKSDLKDLLDFYLIQFLEIFWNFYIFLSVSQCRVLIDF